MTLRKNGIMKIRRELNGAIDRGVETAAVLVKDLASQLAPKDTGDLSRSGVVEGAALSRKRRVVFGRGLPDARAIYQEYGTRHMAAQPYLTPAARAIDVGVEVKKEIQALIGGVAP